MSTEADNSVARFPSPLIGPRRSRPQAIHIVSYPSGYVPRELRQDYEADRLREQQLLEEEQQQEQELARQERRAAKQQQRKQRHTKPRHSATRPRDDSTSSSGSGSASCSAATATATATATGSRNSSGSSNLPPVLGKLLSSFSSNSIGEWPSPESRSDSRSPDTYPSPPAYSSRSEPASAPDRVSTGATSTTTSATTSTIAATATTAPSPPAYDDIRPNSATRDLHALTTLTNTTTATSSTPVVDFRSHHSHGLDPVDHANSILYNVENSSDSNGHLDRFISTDPSSSELAAHAATMAARVAVPLPTAPSAYNASHRNSIMSVRSAKSAVSSLVTEVPKPVASGSGVTCSILFAEPNVFLSGFDHDSNGNRRGQAGTALLRGKLQLRISKNVKIKAIQLKLLGRARTEWPEGIPPLKQDMVEEESLRTQVLTFFNAMYPGWETEYGNQCTYRLKSSSPNGSSTNLSVPNSMSARDMQRLSLQSVQSRSFNKGDNPVVTTTQAKGYKVFYPGTYDYSFELPIDHHQLETIKLQYGSVKWELHATVDRAGAFKPNLHGMREVPIIRVPDQLSLEMSEPISISRQWEDQLHYDIIISGKSFPIGSKIPIAFKLTPLAKVQVHKLKVYVTESIEYWTNDKRVTRKDPGRKILLLEKSAGKPLDSAWASSDLNVIRGGELSPEQRREARDHAARRRASDAARRNGLAEPLPEPTENLLGDLDLGLESFWGSTEIEANVQIPTCEMMAKNKLLTLHPDCSWKNVNVYHWIKVVMRISRLDPEDPAGKKRRHFEISIDSPFTVLNCRATHANTNLPAYSGPNCQGATYQSSCGCPDATSIPTDTSPNSSTGTLPGVVNMSNDNLPAPPQAAHLPASGSDSPLNPRPIHLLRAPSFNPPAFEDDVAPPPAAPEFSEGQLVERILTPPPQYDVVVGTPSVDGLADYFARLAEHDEGQDSGSDSDDVPIRIMERSGRVNVAHPRTPGGRMPSRSLEISRPNIDLDLNALRQRTAARRVAQ